jgi:hypothetical protein
VSQGAVEVAAKAQCVTEVVAGHAIVRFQSKRFSELIDGLVGLALRQKDQSEVVGRFGRSRLEAKGRAAAVGGAVKVALGTVRLGQVGVIDGMVRLQGDGPADALDGLTVIALLMQGDAQQVKCVGVVGLGPEDVAVPPGRLGQPAALVFLQAEAKVVVHGDAIRVEGGG